MKAKAHPLSTPASRMLYGGGIVYVPKDAYLRRLQRLREDENSEAHANFLNPGLGHVMAASDDAVADLFVSVLHAGKGGRDLYGLESIFLSCLQSLQASGNQRLAQAGIAAWIRYTPTKERWPVVVIDRGKNQLKYVPAQQSGKFLKALTPAALLRRQVTDILKKSEGVRDLEPGIAGYRNPAEEVMDCASKTQDWANIFIGAATAVSVGLTAAGMTKSESPTRDKLLDSGVITGLVGGLVGAAERTGLIAAFGCKDDDPPTQKDLNDAVAKITAALQTATNELHAAEAAIAVNADAVAQAIVSTLPADALGDPSEWEGWPGGESPGAALGPAAADTDNTVGEWVANWDAAEPPPAYTPPAPPDDNTPPPDDPDGPPPTGGWTNMPADDSGERNSRPPGVPWPSPPGGYIPNPDDSGPAGPVAFPNGALFVPLAALTLMQRFSSTTLRTASVVTSETGVATAQMSAAAVALGAGGASSGG